MIRMDTLTDITPEAACDHQEVEINCIKPVWWKPLGTLKKISVVIITRGDGNNPTGSSLVTVMMERNMAWLRIRSVYLFCVANA